MGANCSTSASDCKVDWRDQTVLAYGNVTPGKFEANPDIAGIGTVLSFIIPTAVALVLSVILTVSLFLNRLGSAFRLADCYPDSNPPPSERGVIWEPPEDDSDPSSDHESYPPQDDFGSSATIATEPLLQDNHFMNQQTGYYPLQSLQPHIPTPQPQPQRQRPQPQGRLPPQGLPPRWSGRKYPPPKMAPMRVRQIIDPEVRYQKSVTRSERWYDILEAMLMSIPDAQILLSLAVSLNFAVRSKCTLSLYHLRIALNLILIGCTTFVLCLYHCSQLLAGPSGWAPFWEQYGVGEQPEQEPPKSMSNSTILLSANCFLNETLIQTVESSTENANGIAGQLLKIPWNALAENLWFILLILLSAFSSIMRIVRFCLYRCEGPPRKTPNYHAYVNNRGLRRWIRWWALPVWAATVCSVSLALYIKMAWHVFNLRSWVAKSGWIEGDEFSSNPENDFFGLGQTAAMVATLAIIMAGLDRWHPKKEKQD